MPESTCIPEDVRHSIAADAARCFPEECCGLLIGRPTGYTCEIMLALSAVNLATPAVRLSQFVMSASSIFQASAIARQMNAHILGFYHSHPNGVARPSTTDREFCNPWPEYRHVIQPVRNGKPGRARLWRMKDDRWIEEIPV